MYTFSSLVFVCDFKPFFIDVILSFTVCDQITMGISTLFGPRSQHLAAFTDTMCSHLHIPHIEYRETTLAQTLLSGFSINIHPKSDQLSRAYIDLIVRVQFVKDDHDVSRCNPVLENGVILKIVS